MFSLRILFHQLDPFIISGFITPGFPLLRRRVLHEIVYGHFTN